MALEGPLKEFHIQDVFQLLDLGRKSGVLRVTSELRQTEARCLSIGAASWPRVWARTRSASGLAWCGWARSRRRTSIAPGRCRSQGDPRRLGDILVAIGAIARRELDRQLKGQIEETIFDLLGWTEGYFRFEEGAAFEGMVESPVRIATEGLLMESARRHGRVVEDRGQGAAPAGGAQAAASTTTPASGRLDLAPFEWEVLAAVDGERDLHALADTWDNRNSTWPARCSRSPRLGSSCSTTAARGDNGRDPAISLAPAREARGQGRI